MSECSHPDCNKPSQARGVCNTHYMQLRRAGLLPIGTRAPASLEERFWRHVRKTDSCWLWVGSSKDGRGYGQIGSGGRGGKLILVHRLSYIMHKGEIPDGMFVMHACDNPRCVNPEHLSVGTNSDNINDAIAKGRMHPVPPPIQRGSDQHTSKLKESDVRFIRDNPDILAHDLAKKYGTNATSIYKVRSRKTWNHIP